MAALLSAGFSLPAKGGQLEKLAGSILAAVQADGSLDLTQFTCVPSLPDDDTIHDCRDPVSGLGFLHLRDAAGDAMSVSIDKGPAGPADSGILVPDLAAFEALEAEFRALEHSSLIVGLTRCALDRPSGSSALVVLAEPSGVAVLLGFGELDDAARAELESRDVDRAILAAIVIPVVKDYDCKPYAQ